MRVVKSLTGILCALALLVGAGTIHAADKDEKKPCCPASVEGGKKCEHKCCVKAAEEGKVCEKCHPKKDEKK